MSIFCPQIATNLAQILWTTNIVLKESFKCGSESANYRPLLKASFTMLPCGRSSIGKYFSYLLHRSPSLQTKQKLSERLVVAFFVSWDITKKFIAAV